MQSIFFNLICRLWEHWWFNLSRNIRTHRYLLNHLPTLNHDVEWRWYFTQSFVGHTPMTRFMKSWQSRLSYTITHKNNFIYFNRLWKIVTFNVEQWQIAKQNVYKMDLMAHLNHLSHCSAVVIFKGFFFILYSHVKSWSHIVAPT